MEHQTITTSQNSEATVETVAKKKVKKELSPLRKLTAELDDSVKDIEIIKSKIEKLNSDLTVATVKVKSLNSKIQGHLVK
jgi:hypothetical protein